MFFFITIIALLNFALAFEPQCASCKHFVPNVKIFNDLGLCNLFKETSIHKGKEYTRQNYAIHCRENENLCGKAGFLYEPIENPNDQLNVNYNNSYKKNETDETEELEREIFDMLQKIKRHNKKKIYNTTKDLYKLFKRDK
jgi:hypothetical protein